MDNNLDVKKIKIRFKIFEVVNPIILTCSNSSVKTSVLVNGSTRTEDFNIPYNSEPFSIEVSGKTDLDTKIDSTGEIIANAGFEIVDAWVDGILIEKWALASFYRFYPVYTQSQKQYALDHNSPLEEYLTDECSFFFNGLLKFDLTNFFIRYHQIISTGLQNYNQWVKLTSLGLINNSHYEELEYILKRL